MNTANMSDKNILTDYFNTLTDHLANDPKTRGKKAQILTKIIASYLEPQRKYHNIKHLIDLFAQYEKASHLIQSRKAVIAMIFFHDIVYNTHIKDLMAGFSNEEESAKIAEKDLEELGFDKKFITKVARAIRDTSNHLKANPEDMDTKLFLDMDMSILDSVWERYERYAFEEIPAEYAEFDVQAFNQRRMSGFLKTCLSLNSIYKTDLFKEMSKENGYRYKKNLKRELHIRQNLFN